MVSEMKVEQSLLFFLQMADDRMALVNRDPEMGIVSRNSRLPPEW